NPHVHQCPNSIGSKQVEVQGNDDAPIVADQEDAVEVEGVEEGHEVADDVEDGVGDNGRRRVGVTVSTEVGGDGAVAERGER
ncbi:hypothetical protein U1Q18_005243, partial [Sarracenia purpurea var. burkii]